jgi:5,10-methylenetetrahydromethanopterin reductase
MKALAIGVSFDGFQPLATSLEIAREAVAAGAKSLWMAEHLGYREPMTSCMAFALSFPTVKVVPTAISPYLRHPTPTAMALATIAEANDGHAALAVGVGNPMFLGESGIEIEKPLRVVRESVDMLRALWAGEPVRQAGMLHSLRGARLAFAPPKPIPIYLAPMKEQMLRLSGKIADGVVLSAGLSSAFVSHSLGFVDDERARSAEQRPFVKAGYVYFLATRDPRRGISTLRMKLAFLMRNRYIDDNIAHSGLPINQAAIMDAVARRDFDEAARLVPEEAVEAFAIAGTVAECERKIAAFASAGLDEIVLIMAGEPEDWAVGYEVIRRVAQ